MKCPLCKEYKGPSTCRACDGTEEIPAIVEKSIRERHPAKAEEILSALKWAGDHFYFMLGTMYVGVEKNDGYMHT